MIRRFVFALAVVLVGLAAVTMPPYLADAIAQAAVVPAEAAGEVSIRPIADVLLPYFIEAFLVGAFALAFWVAKFIKEKTGIDMEKAIKDIEARHREAMHSAVKSAVAALMAKTGVTNLSFNVGSEDMAGVLRHLRDSVPDALAYFSPPPEVLAKIAEAKLLELSAQQAAASQAPPVR